MNWRFVLRAAFVPAVLLWAAVVAGRWNHTAGDLVTDADAYVLGLRAIAEHGTPYVPAMPAGPAQVGGEFYFVHPPFLVSALAPTGGDRLWVNRILRVAGLLGVVGFAVCLGRLARLPELAAAVLLVLVATPYYGQLHMGNAQLIVDGLSVAALVTPIGVSAALLATAIALKPHAWMVLAVILVRGGGRAIGIAAAVGIAVFGVTALALGAGGAGEAWWTWLRTAAPALAQGEIGGPSWDTMNLSPSARLVWLIWPPVAGSDLPAAARIVLGAIQFGVPAAVAWLTRRRSWREQAGWVLVASTLAAPLFRAGYVAVLLVAPALWWRAREEHAGAAPVPVSGTPEGLRPGVTPP